MFSISHRTSYELMHACCMKVLLQLQPCMWLTCRHGHGLLCCPWHGGGARAALSAHQQVTSGRGQAQAHRGVLLQACTMHAQ